MAEQAATAELIGHCEGCSEPIYAGQPYTEGEEFPGDLWHVDCLPEGGDD